MFLNFVDPVLIYMLVLCRSDHCRADISVCILAKIYIFYNAADR